MAISRPAARAARGEPVILAARTTVIPTVAAKSNIWISRTTSTFWPRMAQHPATSPGPRTIDDAYITFRYAQNLIAGEGLVYNPGEAVLGTTTPVYAVLLAGLGLFSGGGHAAHPTPAPALHAPADA